jgi:peptide/nickel transport system substrate-binding protein
MDLEQGATAKREWAASGGQRGGVLLITTDVWRAVHAQFRPELANPRAILDVRVRRALTHALDKQALNDALFAGEGVMAETVFPPSFDYYASVERAITKYSYDRRRSEQVMNEAGFVRDAEGFYTHLSDGRFSPELKTNASVQNEAERSIIAAGWRQAGFDVREATVPVAQAQDIQVRSTYPSLYNYGRGLGENNLPNFHSANVAGPENRWTGSNRGGWMDPEYDRLVDTLGATLDRDERIRLLVQVAQRMSDELPAIPLYYDLGAVVHTGALRGPGPVSPETTGLVSWNVHVWALR